MAKLSIYCLSHHISNPELMFRLLETIAKDCNRRREPDYLDHSVFLNANTDLLNKQMFRKVLTCMLGKIII